MAESARGGPDSRFNENLIKEVKKHPVVYDTTHPFYSNGAQKQLAWTEIANLLNEKVEVVKTRWRTLRDRYTKERRRVLASGGGSSFSYYADLSFLDAFTAENRNSRRTTNAPSAHVKSEFYEHISNADGTFESQPGDAKVDNDNDDITVLDNMEASTLVSERMSPSEPKKRVTFALPAQESANELQPKRAEGNDSAVQSTSSDTVAVALVTFLDHLNQSRQKRAFSRKRDVQDTTSDKTANIDASESTSLLSERMSPSETANPVPPAISNADNNYEVPSKRLKTADPERQKVATDTVAVALMRSAEALQRLAERKCIFDQSTSGTRDVDECFADFVCLSLKSIDNENRVHARIAILHALAQFQT